MRSARFSEYTAVSCASSNSCVRMKNDNQYVFGGSHQGHRMTGDKNLGLGIKIWETDTFQQQPCWQGADAAVSSSGPVFLDDRRSPRFFVLLYEMINLGCRVAPWWLRTEEMGCALEGCETSCLKSFWILLGGGPRLWYVT